MQRAFWRFCLALCGEVAIRTIKGDALLTFDLQAVPQEHEIQIPTLCATTLGILPQGRKMVLKDLPGIPQQPASQCRLTVVDIATGHESKRITH
jgi:hypothetical protein